VIQITLSNFVDQDRGIKPCRIDLMFLNQALNPESAISSRHGQLLIRSDTALPSSRRSSRSEYGSETNWLSAHLCAWM